MSPSENLRQAIEHCTVAGEQSTERASGAVIAAADIRKVVGRLIESLGSEGRAEDDIVMNSLNAAKSLGKEAIGLMPNSATAADISLWVDEVDNAIETSTAATRVTWRAVALLGLAVVELDNSVGGHSTASIDCVELAGRAQRIIG